MLQHWRMALDYLKCKEIDQIGSQVGDVRLYLALFNVQSMCLSFLIPFSCVRVETGGVLGLLYGQKGRLLGLVWLD